MRSVERKALISSITRGLDKVPTAIAFATAEGTIEHANEAARKLLFTPAIGLTLPLAGPVDQAETGPGSANCNLANGTRVGIDATAVADDLALLIIRDRSLLLPANKDALHQAEAEYESLFQNAVCGIYRDCLDGTPVRANRALFSFNGYSSEEEHISAIKMHGGNFYVDSDRGKYFQHLLQTHGFVRDLVSEVYRHRTKERAWITENAWYVRDANGQPIFIEGTIQDATERVEATAEVERQANTDALTGTTSRFRFMKALHDAVSAPDGTIGLLTIDLDKFKEVNDLFGHSAGDLVLRTVAKRLANATMGFKRTIARLGGDEFAILFSDFLTSGDLHTTSAAIVSAMQEPIDIEGHDVIVGASVGAASYSKALGGAKELLNSADLALYEVKQNGRNDYRVFDPKMKAKHQQRRETEAELRAAIRNDALELYYQPIVQSQNLQTVGYEALMRWNHPTRGFLPPSEFIPLAEECGMMTELGNWAIRRACAQAKLLPSEIQVSVNVSPSQLRSTSIMDAVRRALSDANLPPDRLILEITETAILESEAIASITMAELSALGVGLALDDFGTGYSSLSYLQRYAFSEVKIDRSFVSGIQSTPANRAIIRAVIGLARELKIKVVAEGIETEAQAQILKSEHCELLQGYLFAKPKPFGDVVADLAVKQLKSRSAILFPVATRYSNSPLAGRG